MTINRTLIVALVCVGVMLAWLNVWQHLPVSCTSFELDGMKANVCVTEANMAKMEDSLNALGDKIAANYKEAH